jgi:hypothetical protein
MQEMTHGIVMEGAQGAKQKEKKNEEEKKRVECLGGMRMAM